MTRVGPSNIFVSGMDGFGTVRFTALVPHGRGKRQVDVDVDPELICRIADALRATKGHACDKKHARIADAEEGKFNVGHAVWHVNRPEEVMPCIDPGSVLDVDATPAGRRRLGGGTDVIDGGSLQCTCGCMLDEHGGDRKHPGSTACRSCDDCIAFEAVYEE